MVVLLPTSAAAAVSGGASRGAVHMGRRTRAIKTGEGPPRAKLVVKRASLNHPRQPRGVPSPERVLSLDRRARDRSGGASSGIVSEICARGLPWRVRCGRAPYAGGGAVFTLRLGSV